MTSSHIHAHTRSPCEVRQHHSSSEASGETKGDLGGGSARTPLNGPQTEKFLHGWGQQASLLTYMNAATGGRTGAGQGTLREVEELALSLALPLFSSSSLPVSFPLHFSNYLHFPPFPLPSPSATQYAYTNTYTDKSKIPTERHVRRDVEPHKHRHRYLHRQRLSNTHRHKRGRGTHVQTNKQTNTHTHTVK